VIEGVVGGSGGPIGGLGGATTDAIGGVINDIGNAIGNVFNPPSQGPIGKIYIEERVKQYVQTATCLAYDPATGVCYAEREAEVVREEDALFLKLFDGASREDQEAFRGKVRDREGMTEGKARELFILWYNDDPRFNAIVDVMPVVQPTYKLGPTLEPVRGGPAPPAPPGMGGAQAGFATGYIR
jgi:hypothetical protein